MVFALVTAWALGAAAPGAGECVARFGPFDPPRRYWAAPQPTLLDDGRTVKLAPGGWPEQGVRYYDLAARAFAAAPPQPPRPRLVDKGDGEFDLLDAAGKRLQTFFEPGVYFYPGSWELSADGKYLTTGTDATYSVWRVSTGERLLRRKNVSLSALWLVRGDVALWRDRWEDDAAKRPPTTALSRYDLAAGKELPPLVLPAKGVSGDWTLTPDGREAIVPSEAGIVRLDLVNMAVLPTIPVGAGDTTWGYWRAFAPDGKRLAVVEKGELLILGYPNGKVVTRTTLGLAGGSHVAGIRYSPAGDRIHFVTLGPTAALVFDAATAKEVARHDLEPPPPAPITLDPEPLALALPQGRTGLLLVSQSHRLRLYDLATRRTREALPPPGSWLAAKVAAGGWALAVLTKPDGAAEARQAHFCDLTGAEPRWVRTPVFPSAADGFELSPDGRRLQIEERDPQGMAKVAVYDLATGERRHLLAPPGKPGLIYDPDAKEYRPAYEPRRLTPDWRYELTSHNDQFRVSDLVGGRTVLEEDFLPGKALYPRDALAAAPRGHLVAVATPVPPPKSVGSHRTEPPGRVKLYDARTWRPVRTLSAASGSLAFTGDGRHLVTLDPGSGRAEVFDVSGLASPAPPPLTDAGRREAWRVLETNPNTPPDDPEKWFVSRAPADALWALQHDPDAVAALARKLRPVPVTPPEAVARWVGELGDPAAATRAAAFRKLRALGLPALKPLRAVAPRDLRTDEVLTEQARLAARLLEAAARPAVTEAWHGRATELLERIGTAEARGLLAAYAGGDPEAKLTVEAKRALARLRDAGPR